MTRSLGSLPPSLSPPLSHRYYCLPAMPTLTAFLVRVLLCIQAGFKVIVIYLSVPQTKTTDMNYQA